MGVGSLRTGEGGHYELSDMSVLVQTLALTVEQQTLCCCETGFLAMLELDL